MKLPPQHWIDNYIFTCFSLILCFSIFRVDHSIYQGFLAPKGGCIKSLESWLLNDRKVIFCHKYIASLLQQLNEKHITAAPYPKGSISLQFPNNLTAHRAVDSLHLGMVEQGLCSVSPRHSSGLCMLQVNNAYSCQPS